jgi:hypothetical protein
MQLLFKQALLIDKKRYALGIHEVPKEAMEHAHFKKFMKAGYVIVAGKDDMPKKELKDLPVLPTPKSASAKRSADQAKAIIEKEEAASPVSTIGGEGKKVKGK